MEIKSRSNNGVTKIMHNGIKIYVNPLLQDGSEWVVRSAGNRQLTENEAKEAFELAEGKTPKYINKKFVNKTSPHDFKICL